MIKNNFYLLPKDLLRMAKRRTKDTAIVLSLEAQQLKQAFPSTNLTELLPGFNFWREKNPGVPIQVYIDKRTEILGKHNSNSPRVIPIKGGVYAPAEKAESGDFARAFSASSD